MHLDIQGWVDEILTDGVLQMLTLVSIAVGIGLIIGGISSHKKAEPHNRVWCKLMIVIGTIMVGRNLLSLFGIGH